MSNKTVNNSEESKQTFVSSGLYLKEEVSYKECDSKNISSLQKSPEKPVTQLSGSYLCVDPRQCLHVEAEAYYESTECNENASEEKKLCGSYEYVDPRKCLRFEEEIGDEDETSKNSENVAEIPEEDTIEGTNLPEEIEGEDLIVPFAGKGLLRSLAGGGLAGKK